MDMDRDKASQEVELSDFLSLLNEHGKHDEGFDPLTYRYVNREEIARREREEEERRLAAEERERQRLEHIRQRNKTIAITSAVAAVIMLILGYTFVIKPLVSYKRAGSLMEAKDYSSALGIFSELGSYRNSEELADECRFVLYEPDYQKARKFMTDGNYELAVTYFEKTRGYKDSYSLISECRLAIQRNDYAAAVALMEDGHYDTAISKLSALGGFENSNELIARCEKLKVIGSLRSAAVGDIVTYGAYEQDNNSENGTEPIEWIVLEKADTKALLISQYGLENKQYHSNSRSNVTWESCDMRSWLNDSFLDAAFSEEEASYIETTHVRAEKTEDFDTNPGPDTDDKVFLLSYDQVYQYFDSDNARKCIATDYASRRGAYVGDAGYCWWWSRSPGHEGNYAILVADDGVVYDNYVSGYYMIPMVGTNWGNATAKPAIWVNIE